MNRQGVRKSQGRDPEEGERKTRPFGSSQMSVLQLQQQDAGNVEKGLKTKKERLGHKRKSEP